MIFQEVYGKASGPVTILGAPNETVTYTGKESGSVTLDENGEATVTLKAGEYDFVGSFSSLSGVLREGIKVRPGGTVTMWPDTGKMVYWFGRIGKDEYGTTLAAHFGANSSNTTNTTNSDASGSYRYMGASRYGRGTGSSDADQHVRAKLTFGLIDFAPYNSLSIIGAGASASGSKFAGYGSYSTGSTTFEGGAEEQPGNTLQTFDISAVTGSFYVGVRIYKNRELSQGNSAYYGFRAIWLEV